MNDHSEVYLFLSFNLTSSSPRYGNSEDMHHPRYRTTAPDHDAHYSMDINLDLSDQNDDSMHILPEAIADDNLLFNPLLPS